MTRTIAAIATVTLLAALTGLRAQDPLAPPGQDAKVSVRASFEPAKAHPGERVKLVLDLEVVDGWHVYGSMEKEGEPPTVELGETGGLVAAGAAVVPAGTPHDVYGMETFWVVGTARITQELQVPADQAPGAVKVEGKLDYMACNESMCDPPASVAFTATLDVAAGAAPARGTPSAAPELAPRGDQKVTVTPRITTGAARPGEAVTLEVELTIADGWHVYGKRETTGIPVGISIAPDGPVEAVGSAVVPDGDPHISAGFESWWLVGRATLKQQLKVKAGTPPGTATVRGKLDYMACTEEMCDPPAHLAFEVPITIETGPARAGAAPTQAGAGVEEMQGDVGGLASKSLWGLIAAAIGWGLVTLLMPCTYPMIPITISFFTKQADQRHGSVLPLALAYGLGIVVIFVVIGVVIGPPIATFAAHPITNLVFALMFLLFALVLFGAINLQPPQSLMNLASRASSKGGYLGVFLMGATLVITSFTCTAPLVGSLLALAARGGSTGRVMLGMGMFGATMAVPFVVLSLMPGKLKSLPRSGEWMNTLKITLGFVEVAAALKFLSNSDYTWHWGLLSRELFLFLWAGIFAITGVFLLGMIRLKGESGEIGPGRLVGALAFLVLAIYCGYCGAGNRLDYVLAAIAPPYSNRIAEAGTGSATPAEQPYVVDDFDAARERALAEKKWLLLNFTGYN